MFSKIRIRKFTADCSELREELLAVEEDRMRGSKGYPVDEVVAMMRSAIKKAAGHGTTE